jgi:hypothetical protein
MLTGLIMFVKSDRRDEWHQLPAPHMVIGNQITGDHLTDDCDGAVEITETPPLIILRTTNPLLSDDDHRPRPLRRPTSHRENDKPP